MAIMVAPQECNVGVTERHRGPWRFNGYPTTTTVRLRTPFRGTQRGVTTKIRRQWSNIYAVLWSNLLKSQAPWHRRVFAAKGTAGCWGLDNRSRPNRNADSTNGKVGPSIIISNFPVDESLWHYHGTIVGFHGGTMVKPWWHYHICAVPRWCKCDTEEGTWRCYQGLYWNAKGVQNIIHIVAVFYEAHGRREQQDHRYLAPLDVHRRRSSKAHEPCV